MRSMWSADHRSSPSKRPQEEGQCQSIWICHDKSRSLPHLPCGTNSTAAATQGSTGKAEYSERGPLSLREHGGETYWLQSQHRRSTLTPPLPSSSPSKTQHVS